MGRKWCIRGILLNVYSCRYETCKGSSASLKCAINIRGRRNYYKSRGLCYTLFERHSSPAMWCKYFCWEHVLHRNKRRLYIIRCVGVPTTVPIRRWWMKFGQGREEEHIYRKAVFNSTNCSTDMLNPIHCCIRPTFPAVFCISVSHVRNKWLESHQK